MCKIKTNFSKNFNHVVFLGEARFPFGFAAVQRMTLMAKALLYMGIKPIVICRKGSWDWNEHIDFDYKGNFEGIDYIYTSKVVHKPSGFLRRNIQKLRGIYGEYKYLKQLKRDGGIDMAIVANRKLFHVVRYIFYSSFLNFPIALNLVEMASSMQNRTNFFAKINDYLLDEYIIRLFDGALPISDKLMTFYRLKVTSKPAKKIPIICDFEKFNIAKDNTQESYFLYCGGVDYEQVRDFVIEAYNKMTYKRGYKLYMIISAEDQSRITGLQQRLQKKYNTVNIKVFSNISYQELVDLYINAKALLIPLRNTIQDISRFPHKIGEYLASGNPVITTNIGEIENYFKDGETALVADTYNIDLFSKKMKYVLDYPEISKKIGIAGKKMGFKEFDYRAHGNKLLNFLKDLKDHK
jgi:glycosyltransferase involved in cell wall biosynthesis